MLVDYTNPRDPLAHVYAHFAQVYGPTILRNASSEMEADSPAFRRMVWEEVERQANPVVGRSPLR